MVAVFIVISVAFLISGRKKFLLYFVALYPVLPDYFGIELGVGLPLLKANRILLILLFIAVLIYYRNVDIFPKQRFINAKIYAGLLIYFSCRIIANAYYVTNLSEAINAEFTIIVEQFLLLVLLIQFIRDESELQEIIDIIVKVSGIIALVCFINIAIGENLFYYLKTIERSVMMTSTERMGIVRAEATFGHPVYYSVYTALMLPLALYLYQNKKKVKISDTDDDEHSCIVFDRNTGNNCCTIHFCYYCIYQNGASRQTKICVFVCGSGNGVSDFIFIEF